MGLFVAFRSINKGIFFLPLKMSTIFLGVVQQLDLRKNERKKEKKMMGWHHFSVALLFLLSVRFPRMVSFIQSERPVFAALTQG